MKNTKDGLLQETNFTTQDQVIWEKSFDSFDSADLQGSVAQKGSVAPQGPSAPRGPSENSVHDPTGNHQSEFKTHQSTFINQQSAISNQQSELLT